MTPPITVLSATPALAPPLPQPTVGLDLNPALRAWANAFDVVTELENLVSVLLLESRLHFDYLPSALDGLASCGARLRQWRASGTETYGLERLADVWRQSKDVVGRLTYRPDTHDPLRDFPAGHADSHYLYLLLVSRPAPLDPDDSLTTLRAWTLIKAFELARRGVRKDRRLRELCRCLRMAAYEFQPDWAPVLGSLASVHGTFDSVTGSLSGALKGAVGRLPAGFILEDKHKALARDAGLLAMGNLAELDGPQIGPPRPLIAFSSTNDPVFDSLDLDDGEFPALLPAPLGVLVEPDEDDVVVPVDPNAPPRQQDLEARSIHLISRFDASLVRWRWNVVSPAEIDALRERIETSLRRTGREDEQLLAALTWVGLQTGRALHEVGRISITPGAQEFSHWRVDVEHSKLTREPPRRVGAWMPDEASASLILPLAERLGWVVPEAVIALLREITQRLSAQPSYLADLWQAVSSVRVETAFAHWARRDTRTERLRSSMLAGWLKQRVFESTGDPLLARLMGSREREALPAAASYGAYLAEDLGPLQCVEPIPVGGPARLNVAGSRMFLPSDEVLVERFRAGLSSIEEARQRQSDIDAHNRIVLYWDAVLRAATGVRPNAGIWTRLSAFDWTHGFVFIDDKASPLGRKGRLVPIPRALLDAFRVRFVNSHLHAARGLIEHMGVAYDPGFAGDLLFLIDTTAGGAAQCRPVERRDRVTFGIESPLPANVFRHRLSRKLVARGAEVELVQALMGHADGSSATHGPYSMRCWWDDAQALRPHLDALFGELQIQWPPLSKVVRPDSPAPISAPTRAGTRDRNLSMRRAITDADATIEEFLKQELGSTHADGETASRATVLEGLTQLTTQQLGQLEHRLTRTSKDMPSVMGPLRHARLVKLSREAWDTLGRPVRVGGRVTSLEPEPSVFTADAPGAIDLRARLRGIVETLFDQRPHPSQVSVTTARILASLDLIITARIAAPKVQHDVLHRRERCRLTRLGDAQYLEWSPDQDLAEVPLAAVQRFRIAYRTACLLQAVFRAEKHHPLETPASTLLEPVREALRLAPSATFGWLLQAASAVVSQCNSIELPGSVAAYLNGQLMTAALGHADLLRWRRGAFFDLPTTKAGDLPSPGLPPRVVDRTRPIRAMDRLGTCTTARSLIKRTAEQLESLRQPNATRHRQQGLAKLAAETAKDTTTSSSIRLLCLWAVDRLTLDPPAPTPDSPPTAVSSNAGARKRRKSIQTVSVTRYLSALRHAFIDLASDVDVLDLDAEELTTLFQQVLEGSTARNTGYVYQRLRDFHRFILRYGAASVDWSELVAGDAPCLGAPGFIDEEAYLEVFDALQVLPPPVGVEAWQLQAFILLAFRFGLRGGEVLHLDRDDWTSTPDGTLVIVLRPRRLQRLKSSAARRQVPLLFELTSAEQAILDRLQHGARPATHGLDRAPMLWHADDPSRRLDLEVTRHHLNEIVKMVTGQAGLTLHDLRHGFACEVWRALEQPHLPTDARRSTLTGAQALQARDLLLGPGVQTRTRRSAWVLASLLGHSQPSVSLRSYVHLVPEAAESCVATEFRDIKTWSKRPSRIDCMEGSSRPREPHEIKGVAQTPQVTSPAQVLDVLLGLHQGRSPGQVAATTGAPVALIDDLQGLAQRLDQALGQKEYGGKDRMHLRCSAAGLLQRLERSAFQRVRHALSGARLRAGAEASQANGFARELEGMVGTDRTINLWTTEQTSWVAAFTREVVDRSRLRLVGSPGLSSDLRNAAVLHGLVREHSPGPPSVQAALCDDYDEQRLCRTQPFGAEGMQITRRFELIIAAGSVGGLHDRIEWWIGALCFVTYLRILAERRPR